MSRPIKTIAVDTTDSRSIWSNPDTDGKIRTYRLTQIQIMDDGEHWFFGVMQTKTGRDYKSGIGVSITVNWAVAHHQPAVVELVTELINADPAYQNRKATLAAAANMVELANRLAPADPEPSPAEPFKPTAQSALRLAWVATSILEETSTTVRSHIDISPISWLTRMQLSVPDKTDDQRLDVAQKLVERLALQLGAVFTHAIPGPDSWSATSQYVHYVWQGSTDEGGIDIVVLIRNPNYGRPADVDAAHTEAIEESFARILAEADGEQSAPVVPRAPKVDERIKPGTRVRDTSPDGSGDLGTFQGWDPDGYALIRWDGYRDPDLCCRYWEPITIPADGALGIDQVDGDQHAPVALGTDYAGHPITAGTLLMAWQE